MKGIVCDVGHTIITNSILNEILERFNQQGAIKKLYDEDFLMDKTQEEIDDWVKKTSSNKINNLKGISIDDIANVCIDAKITDGFKDFIFFVCNHNIPIIFIGAVPIIITEFLLKKCGVLSSVHNNIHIEGTSIEITNKKIIRPLKICTPSIKKEIVKEWSLKLGINENDLFIIGDSLGDIPTMKLTSTNNRYGIHVNSRSLKALLSKEVATFYELLSIIKRNINK